jgi:hypothetical protein
MAKVKAQAAPSPFGKNAETVVDETVRKAHELRPGQFTLAGGFDGTLPAHILEQVRRSMLCLVECGSAIRDPRTDPRSCLAPSYRFAPSSCLTQRASPPSCTRSTSTRTEDSSLTTRWATPRAPLLAPPPTPSAARP